LADGAPLNLTVFFRYAETEGNTIMPSSEENRGVATMHVTPEGETIVSLAEQTGHYWQTLWNDPANAELKAARKNPNVLRAGDRVNIPPLRQKQEACVTGGVHRFRRKGVPVKIAFQLRTSSGLKFAGTRYELSVGERVYSGTTGPEGELEEWVAPVATRGRLVVWLAMPGYPERVEWTLHIGACNPIDTPEGVERRLKMLGYDVLPGNPRDALLAFQQDQKLTVTGEADDGTRERLQTVFGY
jgi:hypothetical protein